MQLLKNESNSIRFRLVDEAIDSGYFTICKKFEEIIPRIIELNKKEVNFNQKKSLLSIPRIILTIVKINCQAL